MAKSGMCCRVTGKVQGVWFRASTKTQAEALGLTGWAKNLPDGSVEVCAYGEKERLSELYDWLHQGPPRAEVNAVTHEEITWCEYQDFKTL